MQKITFTKGILLLVMALVLCVSFMTA